MDNEGIITSKHEVEDLMYRGLRSAFFTEEYIDYFNQRMVNIFLANLANQDDTRVSCILTGDTRPLVMLYGKPLREEGMVGDYIYYKMPHVLHILNPDNDNCIRFCLNHKRPAVLVSYFSNTRTDSSSFNIIKAEQVSIEVHRRERIERLDSIMKFQNFLTFGEMLDEVGVAAPVH